jgi:hypothetical protein
MEDFGPILADGGVAAQTKPEKNWGRVNALGASAKNAGLPCAVYLPSDNGAFFRHYVAVQQECGRPRNSAPMYGREGVLRSCRI